jgi:hypothetical protein
MTLIGVVATPFDWLHAKSVGACSKASSPPRSLRTLREETRCSVVGGWISAKLNRGHGACGCTKIPATGFRFENARTPIFETAKEQHATAIFGERRKVGGAGGAHSVGGGIGQRHRQLH